jgi:hypothetical protein
LTRTHSDARRKRLLTRALPLVLLALVSFVVGIVVAAGSSEKDAVQRFGDAWEQGDWAAMRAELTPASQRSTPRRIWRRATRKPSGSPRPPASTSATRAGR